MNSFLSGHRGATLSTLELQGLCQNMVTFVKWHLALQRSGHACMLLEEALQRRDVGEMPALTGHRFVHSFSAFQSEAAISLACQENFLSAKSRVTLKNS